jgi:glyoxylase-like metal-dependent hydrolase (beta-lactamase superfamily II)
MAKAFASTADLAEKKVTFAKLADGVYAYTAEGDPNSGIIIGEDGVMVIDARATPVMAEDLIRRVREVTDKPFKYVVLTHYHAVRVMGASAFRAPYVISSHGTLDLIRERGRQDFKSEVGRFPRLFDAVGTVPGLTWPNMTFERSMTLFLGKREVWLMHLGRAHTKGDIVVWLPREKILFSGDLVEQGATPYCGDAYLTDWPQTLERAKSLGARKLVPGRGEAMLTPAKSRKAIEATQSFIVAMMREVRKGAKAKKPLRRVYEATHARLQPAYGKWVIFDHCLPFNVTRAYDEALGVRHPRIWTAQRDREMWKALQG